MRLKRSTVVLIICVGVLLGLGLASGVARGLSVQRQLGVYNSLMGQPVDFLVTAQEDAVYGLNSQLTFNGGNVQTLSGQKLIGKISVSGFGLNAVFAGDRVEVQGKLRPGYGSDQGELGFAHLSLVGHHPSAISEVRRRFIAGMQSALPEPLASFSMGLLIGQRATLPATTKHELLAIGLTHIIAVSGYNLTIILNATQKLLAGYYKRLSAVFGLGLIFVFVLLAGSSASIVRAAIVSTLGILTGYYGRKVKPLNLILLAAAATAWMNPVYIWKDASWYLSFLAFYGVLVLAPIVSAKWPENWHKSVLIGVALESVCAEVMTMPYILHNFGQISLLGLPANILITTLVPLAMLLGLVAGLAGMLALQVTGWLAWPAKQLLTYMLDTAHLLSSVPHSFLQNLELPLTGMLACYALIALASYLKYVKITDKNERTQQMVNNQAGKGR